MTVKNFYNQKSLTYGIRSPREKKIFGLLGNNLTDKIVLDVGCSTGYLGQKIKKKGAKVFGIDISAAAIKKARKILDWATINDLNQQKLPFKANSVDIVIASEVIEHLYNPSFALGEFNRILKKDGFLILTTPNFLYWANRLLFLKGIFRYTESGMFDKGHIHFFTWEMLQQELTAADFQITKSNHIFAGNLFPGRGFFPSLFAYQFVVKAHKK